MLFWSGVDGDSIALPFEADGGEEVSDAEFEAAKSRYYSWLATAGIPGKAWFRFSAQEEESFVSLPEVERNQSLDRLFRYTSGGLSVSENLAFDRDLPLSDDAESELKTIPISNVQGVTVPSFDWAGLLPEEAEAPGGLASWVPADQYWLSIPSTEALGKLFGISSGRGEALLTMLPLPGAYPGLYKRYEEQMALVDFRVALLSENAPEANFALTGGDPFFPTGTDVALLIDAEDSKVVGDLILASVTAGIEGAELLTEKISGIDVLSYETTDRSFSVFVASLSDRIWAVTNSRLQMERLISTGAGEIDSVDTLDETRYFRSVRYPSQPDEMFFLLLSDDAIRSWASPERRIANARRLRAAAGLMEQTAERIPGWASMEGITLAQMEEALPSDPIYNTLHFLTPVSEIDVATVTPDEKNAYERWRRGYERGWRYMFDPIAVRMTESSQGMEVGLSVIPLRVDSQYNQLIRLTGEAEIRPDHRNVSAPVLVMLSMALDIKSAPFLQYENLASSFFPQFAEQGFAWIDESLSVFWADSLLWDAVELSDDPTRLIERSFSHLPLGLRIESKSSFRLAAFLTGLRAMAEQSAPGLVNWSTREVDGIRYNAIVPADGESGSFEDISAFYLAAPKGLTVSIDESIVRDQATPGKSGGFAGLPLQGKHLNLEWTQKAIKRFVPLLSDGIRKLTLEESWSWLPVLGEWKRLFPHLNPAEVHAVLWAEPVAGTYTWNADLQSMTSEAAGSPAAPNELDSLPLSWVEQLGGGAMGITFANGGLEAKALFQKAAESEPAEIKPAEGEGISALKHYPLEDGWEYEYRVDYGYEGEGEIKQVVKVRQLENDEEGAEIFEVSVIEQYPDEPYAWTEIWKRDEDLRVMSYLYDGEVENYTPGYLLMPAIFYQNQPIKNRSKSFDSESEAIGIDVIEMEFVGFEDIEVTAGTFSECLRLDYRYVYDGGGFLTIGTGTDWFSEEVGLVKSVWSEGSITGYQELVRLQK